MAFIAALSSLGRGALTATIGLAIGVGFGMGVAAITGRPPAEIAIAIGYVFALFGWLLGVGMWGIWSREWFGLKPRSWRTEGWQRYFTFSLDHKVIGVQYVTTFIALFLLAGLFALLLRLELMSPGQDFLGPNEFNTAMGLHGIIMVAVAVATIMGGFANYVLPMMIGADDVAFPRLNALSY